MSEDDRLDEMLSNSAIHVYPERLTPSTGVNLGKLVTFANCRTSIRAEPSKVLFVSLPAFGTAQGGKNSNCSLRNLSQLILIHLEDPGRQVIIDGAAGNPAWNHDGLLPLKEHSRWTEPIKYLWCSGGSLFRQEAVPFVTSTIPLPNIDQWGQCCGSSWQEHSTGRSSPDWSRANSSEKRYLPLVWQGFMKYVDNSC